MLSGLGPAHTTPRGVGLMAWAIRRSVFSSHAGAGPSRKGRFAALFLENRPRKNLLFLLFRPLLLFFEGLFRVEIYKLEQNRADQLFYR